ncbi:MAG: ATP-grasp domain-containing protein [Clostridia bacterium]|nr:ATP-grasp domain-containing protein [Clostridia bacterium]
MRKVAVFFGGKSSEREISVLTGVFALNVLGKDTYDILPVYVGEDGNFYTAEKMVDLAVFKGKEQNFSQVFFDSGKGYCWDKKRKHARCLGTIDVALNCCHGGILEGGGVSALMTMQGVAVASPDLASSSIFMDKTLTKLFAKSLGIPVVDYVRVEEKDYRKRGKYLLKTVSLRLKYPVVVKPARQGSSIGVCVANDEGQLQKALETAFSLDTLAVVEKYLPKKKDVNCAAYRLQGEIILSEAEVANSDDGVYDFSKKYLKEGGDFLKGGGRVTLEGKLRDKIRHYTKLLYKRLGVSGVVRADFLIGGEGEVYLSEVNAVPGSLAYYLFCERLTDAKEFFCDLIEEGILEQERRQKQIPETGVLTGITLRK